MKRAAAADQCDRGDNHGKLESLFEKALNRFAKQEDQGSDCEHSRAPANQRRKDKRQLGHIQYASSDGKDFVWDWRNRRDDYCPHAVTGEQSFDLLHLVGRYELV